MATPVRTITTSMNNILNQPAVEDQFRECLFQLKETAVAAGWVVEQSCNGVSVDTEDLWDIPTEIPNLNSGSGHSWVVLSTPVTFTHKTSILLSTKNILSGFPEFDFKFTKGSFTGGTTSVLPTATSPVITAPGDRFFNWTITTGRTGSYCTWTMDDGSFWFAVKEPGEKIFHTVILVETGTQTTDANDGQYRLLVCVNHQSTANAWGASLGTNMRTINYNGFESSGTKVVYSHVRAGTVGWLDGQSGNGQTLVSPFRVGVNTSIGRFLGTIFDLWGGPTNLAYGVLDDSENGQTQRLVGVGDGAMVFVTASQLPIL